MSKAFVWFHNSSDSPSAATAFYEKLARARKRLRDRGDPEGAAPQASSIASMPCCKPSRCCSTRGIGPLTRISQFGPTCVGWPLALGTR